MDTLISGAWLDYTSMASRRVLSISWTAHHVFVHSASQEKTKRRTGQVNKGPWKLKLQINMTFLSYSRHWSTSRLFSGKSPLLDGNAMLLELSLSVVLGFLTSVRVCQTRITASVSLVGARQSCVSRGERALTMQGRFEPTKDPVGFLAHEGGIVNGRSSVIENAFMVDVVAGYIRAIGFDNHLFYSAI